MNVITDRSKKRASIVPTPLVGGRNYILKWFFCSVNFGRSIYSS